MVNKPIKFTTFKRIMKDLGFDFHATKPGPLVFRHAPTDTILLFPKGTTSVTPERIAGFRPILIGRGAVSDEGFDEHFRARRRARKTVA